MSAQVSLEVFTKSSFRGNKIQNISIFKALFWKQKRRSVTKKTEMSFMNLVLLFFIQPHIFWKWMHTKSECTLLCLCFRQRSATKEISVSPINLECSCLVQVHLFWKWVCIFQWKLPPKAPLEFKNVENLDLEGFFLKQKGSGETKRKQVSIIKLKCWCFFQILVFWKWEHTIHWK